MGRIVSVLLQITIHCMNHRVAVKWINCMLSLTDLESMHSIKILIMQCTQVSRKLDIPCEAVVPSVFHRALMLFTQSGEDFLKVSVTV